MGKIIWKWLNGRCKRRLHHINFLIRRGSIRNTIKGRESGSGKQLSMADSALCPIHDAPTHFHDHSQNWLNAGRERSKARARHMGRCDFCVERGRVRRCTKWKPSMFSVKKWIVVVVISVFLTACDGAVFHMDGSTTANEQETENPVGINTVSYTHLTLPTICSV